MLGVCNGNNCGYLNVETGQVVIKPQYYYVYDFKEGVTRVGKYSSSSYSYMDTTGEVIVPLE
ncbi:WG repeat-containing protein [Paenibacillus sp. 1_12]|uniref:WG repeat-containing protein n=1 Tax=Paenibacillus sp. 1_12 TaxID=1566278 RepID=UPI000B839DBE